MEEEIGRSGTQKDSPKLETTTKRRRQLELSEKKEDMWKKIAQLSENQRQRIKRLWILVTDSASSRKEKMRALDLLQKEDELFIKRGQIAGVLLKDAPLIAIQNNTVVKLNIKDEFKEFVSLLEQNKK